MQYDNESTSDNWWDRGFKQLKNISRNHIKVLGDVNSGTAAHG